MEEILMLLLLSFLLSTLSVETNPHIVGGPINYNCDVQITNNSSKPETVSVALILGKEDGLYNMSVPETYIWLDKVPQIKYKARYGYKEFMSGQPKVGKLGGYLPLIFQEEWSNKYVDMMGDTVECEKGCYWCKKWGIKCGELLDKYTVADSNALLRRVPYIVYGSRYVDVKEKSIPHLEGIDKRIVAIDSVASDVSKISKATATSKLRLAQSRVGKKFKQRKVVKDEVTRGGLKDVILPANQSVKLRIVFRTEKAMRSKERFNGKVTEIGGSHGIVIKNSNTGKELFKKIYNTWKSGWDWCHTIVINTDSLSGENLSNFPLPVKWRSKVTDTSHFIGRIYTQDGSDLWSSTEGNSTDWPLVTTINENGDSFKVWGKASGGLSKDSSEMVFDTTEDWEMVLHMNETSGTIYDATYNNNDGDTSGVAMDTTGQINGGCYFSANDDYISVADNASLDLPDEIMFEVCARTKVVNATWDVIFGKYVSAGQNTFQLGLNASGNKIYLNLRKVGSSVTVYSNSALDTLSTYYVVGLRDSTDTLRLYVDGVEQNDVKILTGDLYTNNDPVWIGTSETYDFYGFLDEARISRKAKGSEWIRMQNLALRDSLLTFRAEESEPMLTLDGTVGLEGVLTDSSGSIVYLDSLTSGHIDTTNSHGAYEITTAGAGTYWLHFIHSGYSPDSINVVLSSDTTIDTSLTACPVVYYDYETGYAGFGIDPPTEMVHSGGNVKGDTGKFNTYTGLPTTITHSDTSDVSAQAWESYNADYSDSAGNCDSATFADTAGYARKTDTLGGEPATDYFRTDRSDTTVGNIVVKGANLYILIDGVSNTYLKIDRGTANRRGVLTFLTAGAKKWSVGLPDSGEAGCMDGTEFFIGRADDGLGAEFVIKTNGNVGIDTLDPQAKLDVNGDAIVRGNCDADTFKYSSAMTRYYSVNSSVLQPQTDNIDYVKNGEKLYLPTGTGGFDGTVNLPHGATIDSLFAYIVDSTTTANEDIDVYLDRITMDGETTVNLCHFVSVDSNLTPVYYSAQANASYNVVDNTSYNYVVNVVISGAYTHGLSMRGAGIKYTITHSAP